MTHRWITIIIKRANGEVVEAQHSYKAILNYGLACAIKWQGKQGFHVNTDIVEVSVERNTELASGWKTIVT